MAGLPVITDDGTVWPEDQPAAQTPPANPPSDGGYWIPRILNNLWQTAKSGFTLPGDVATGKASMSDPQTQKRVGDMTALLQGGGLTEAADADALGTGFRLFHGTKSYFDKPSTQFINTGQGAQTYGWGLYGAQAEPVALDMRNQLAPKAVITKPNGQEFDIQDAHNVLWDGGADPPRPGAMRIAYNRMLSSNSWEDYLSKLNSIDLNQLEQFPSVVLDVRQERRLAGLMSANPPTILRPSAGHMQEWEVNADPEHFLDWDYLASEQSQHVMDALQKAKFWPDLEEHLINDDKFGLRNPTGRDIYRWVAEDEGPMEASNMLLDQGIPGIRVLDQHSRLEAAKHMGIPRPDATRNFVLPDEDMIKVVRHYNAAGVPAALANIASGPGGQTP